MAVPRFKVQLCYGQLVGTFGGMNVLSFYMFYYFQSQYYSTTFTYTILNPMVTFKIRINCYIHWKADIYPIIFESISSRYGIISTTYPFTRSVIVLMMLIVILFWLSDPPQCIPEIIKSLHWYPSHGIQVLLQLKNICSVKLLTKTMPLILIQNKLLASLFKKIYRGLFYWSLFFSYFSQLFIFLSKIIAFNQ